MREYFVAVCSVASLSGIFLEGIFLWFFLFKRDKDEGLNEFKIFGMEAKGSGKTIFIVLGAVLILFPLYLIGNYSKGSEPQSAALPSNTVPAPDKSKIKTYVGSIDSVKSGVLFIKDYQLLDLRFSIHPKSDSIAINTANRIRYVLAKLTAPEVKSIDFEYATSSDSPIHFHCLTHQGDVENYGSTKPHFHGTTLMKNIGILKVDVSDERLNDQFVIMNEATYFKAFDGDDSDWAAIHSVYPTNQLGMVVLFAKERPCKSYEVFEQKNGSPNERLCMKNCRIISSENNLVLNLIVENPQPEYTYIIRWNWDKI